jgi:cobalt-zinc-cadmium efflux system outer membrane protein
MRITKFLTIWFVAAVLALSGSDGVADGAVSVEQVTVSFEPILLGQVLDQVRQHNAALAVAQSDIQVAQGRRRQAGLLSNPELELEVEEMATNEFGDFGKSINTFSITQEIQTAGRRQTARAIADAEVEISSIEYQVLEREVLTKATKAFFALLAAQEHVVVFDRLLKTARSSEAASRALVDAGDAASVDRVRAQVAVSQALIGQRQAIVETANARGALYELMATPNEALPSVGPAAALYEVPPAAGSDASLLAGLDQHPVIRGTLSAVALAAEERDLACEQRYPNVELTFGLESAPSDGDRRQESFVMALGVPLPIFDRNEGTVAAAAAAHLQAQRVYDAAMIELTTQMRQARRNFVAARQAAEAYRDDVVPGARRVFDLVRQLYEAGEIGQLELLAAQQALIEAEVAYIDTLAGLREVQAELQSFTVAAPHE